MVRSVVRGSYSVGHGVKLAVLIVSYTQTKGAVPFGSLFRRDFEVQLKENMVTVHGLLLPMEVWKSVGGSSRVRLIK